MDWDKAIKSPCEELFFTEFQEKGIRCWLKRDDQIHEHVSGNKWRKLKYVMKKVQEEKHSSVLTFGGAFSNHIAATAEAAQLSGVSSIGVIRGEEVLPLNPTLLRAKKLGMRLIFVSRKEYRENKKGLAQRYRANEDCFVIPEGGASELGVQGCKEILDEVPEVDIVACAAGTGTTAAGILRRIGPAQKLWVFSALKGRFLQDDILSLARASEHQENRLYLSDDYCFGGYAKTSIELFEFLRRAYAENSVKFDPIYTGKMMYGLLQEAKNGNIEKGSRILAVHTGGLQGIAGIEARDRVNIFDTSVFRMGDGMNSA